MASDLSALLPGAIGAATKKLRSFLNDDYGKYEATLHALDVVEALLLGFPLDHHHLTRAGRRDVDPAVMAARNKWMLRLDQAANELEDLVQDMEEAVAAARARWWRRGAPEDAVARWLDSDDENMSRMEVTVGRLASVYVHGGAIFCVPSAGEAASERRDDDGASLNFDQSHSGQGKTTSPCRRTDLRLRSLTEKSSQHCIPGV